MSDHEDKPVDGGYQGGRVYGYRGCNGKCAKGSDGRWYDPDCPEHGADRSGQGTCELVPGGLGGIATSGEGSSVPPVTRERHIELQAKDRESCENQTTGDSEIKTEHTSSGLKPEPEPLEPVGTILVLPEERGWTRKFVVRHSDGWFRINVVGDGETLNAIDFSETQFAALRRDKRAEDLESDLCICRNKLAGERGLRRDVDARFRENCEALTKAKDELSKERAAHADTKDELRGSLQFHRLLSKERDQLKSELLLERARVDELEDKLDTERRLHKMALIRVDELTKDSDTEAEAGKPIWEGQCPHCRAHLEVYAGKVEAKPKRTREDIQRELLSHDIGTAAGLDRTIALAEELRDLKE